MKNFLLGVTSFSKGYSGKSMTWNKGVWFHKLDLALSNAFIKELNKAELA